MLLGYIICIEKNYNPMTVFPSAPPMFSAPGIYVFVGTGQTEPSVFAIQSQRKVKLIIIIAAWSLFNEP